MVTNFDQTIEKGIIASIAYFDIFDYPLTLQEVHKWLYIPEHRRKNQGKISMGGLLKLIQSSAIITRAISHKNGFYFFKNRETTIKKRLENYTHAERKFKRAKWFIRIIKFFPYIRYIGVCNTLGYSNAKKDADIDLLIIVKHHHLWTARFWTTLFAKALRIRPENNNTRDKICLSFFLSDRHLNIQSLQAGENDVYLKYWISHIVPLYDEKDYGQMFKLENKWIEESIHFHAGYRPLQRRKESHTFAANLLKRSIEWLQDGWWEDFLKYVQKVIMPRKLKRSMNTGTHVVCDHRMLKFHENDRRNQYHEQWLRKIKTLTYAREEKNFKAI